MRRVVLYDRRRRRSSACLCRCPSPLSLFVCIIISPASFFVVIVVPYVTPRLWLSPAFGRLRLLDHVHLFGPCSSFFRVSLASPVAYSLTTPYTHHNELFLVSPDISLLSPLESRRSLDLRRFATFLFRCSQYLLCVLFLRNARPEKIPSVFVSCALCAIPRLCWRDLFFGTDRRCNPVGNVTNDGTGFSLLRASFFPGSTALCECAGAENTM